MRFLRHEAQHFADRQDFPGLPGTDLEYRAKLVELICAASPRLQLQAFCAEAAERPGHPHAYAALQLARDLARALGLSAGKTLEACLDDLEEARIRWAVRSLLEAHGAELRAGGRGRWPDPARRPG